MAYQMFTGNTGPLRAPDLSGIKRGAEAYGEMYKGLGQAAGAAIEKYQLNKQKRDVAEQAFQGTIAALSKAPGGLAANLTPEEQATVDRITKNGGTMLDFDKFNARKAGFNQQQAAMAARAKAALEAELAQTTLNAKKQEFKLKKDAADNAKFATDSFKTQLAQTDRMIDSGVIKLEDLDNQQRMMLEFRNAINAGSLPADAFSGTNVANWLKLNQDVAAADRAEDVETRMGQYETYEAAMTALRKIPDADGRVEPLGVDAKGNPRYAIASVTYDSPTPPPAYSEVKLPGAAGAAPVVVADFYSGPGGKLYKHDPAMKTFDIVGAVTPVGELSAITDAITTMSESNDMRTWMFAINNLMAGKGTLEQMIRNGEIIYEDHNGVEVRWKRPTPTLKALEANYGVILGLTNQLPQLTEAVTGRAP